MHSPGPTMSEIGELNRIANMPLQIDTRLILTDADGWRIAEVGELGTGRGGPGASKLVRRIYDLLLEKGK